MRSCLHPRSLLDGSTNALIGAAAANVAGHGVLDLLVSWLGSLRQQRNGLHDLPRLAVSALGNRVLDPSNLNGVQFIRAGNRFDGDDFLPGDSAHRRRTRAHRLAVAVYGTRATQTHTAAELRARQAGNVAYIPEQGHRRVAVKGPRLPIQFELDHD